MVDAMTSFCERQVACLKVASDEELQVEIDRPFKGGLNPDFDFNKWCAIIILQTRGKFGLTREDKW